MSISTSRLTLITMLLMPVDIPCKHTTGLKLKQITSPQPINCVDYFNITKGGSGVELNKIYNEDCLEGMKRIPDGSVDMILCDLPYGLTASKWDNTIPNEPLWEQYERVIKNNGAIVLFGNEPFSSHLRMSNIKKYRYDWKWDKVRGSNFATVNRRPFNSFEDIMVFYKKQPTYNPQFWQGKPYEQKQGYVGEGKQTGLSRKEVVTKSDGRRYPLSIIRFRKENGLHPTQKPVALFEYLIKTYTNEGELVLDNCMGSGTTAIASMRTGRNYIGFELDEEYYKVAQQRIIDENTYLESQSR